MLLYTHNKHLVSGYENHEYSIKNMVEKKINAYIHDVNVYDRVKTQAYFTELQNI